MTDQHTEDATGDNDQDIAQLFDGIAPRREPPADVQQRVTAHLERSWQARKRRRRLVPIGLAASLAVAALLVFEQPGVDDQLQFEVATTGGFEVAGERLNSGVEQLAIDPGALLTASTATRLITPTGADLRLRAGTQVHFDTDQALTLEQGAIYIATDGDSGFRVTAADAVVTDIGTRFLVSLDAGVVEVAMRDGMTRIDSPAGQATATTAAGSGDVVRVEADQLVTRRERLDAPRWDWIHRVRPSYSGTNVAGLLEQITADLGLKLEYQDATVAAAAAAQDISGDLSQLEPAAALEVVLGAAGLQRLDSDAGTVTVVLQTDSNQR